MSVTPNMNLILPEPTTTPGPAWASQLNTALNAVDSHDHSSGGGKKVTPAGIDINVDLDLQQHSLVNANKVNLTNQSAALTGVSNACSISFAGGNFYITNSGGLAVQVTNGTSVVNTTVIPSSPLMPAGTVLDFAGITVPPGFLSCNGAAVSRSTYSDLFAAIGTSWGVGDGSTTFLLPDSQGRTSVGAGTYADDVAGSVTRSLSQKVGASTHVLTEAQLAAHTHIQDAHTHEIVRAYSSGGSNGSMGDSGYLGTLPSALATTATNQYTGGNQAHNNMQPSFVVNKIIKY